MKNWQKISNEIYQNAIERKQRLADVRNGLIAINEAHKSKTDAPFIFSTGNRRYLLNPDNNKLQVWEVDVHESGWAYVDDETTEKLYYYLCEECCG